MTNWRGGGILRDKYDSLFSHLVRERADWCCEYCGRNCRFDSHNLHCSHLFGRRKQSVRLHPWNAFAHCMTCHQRLGEHPVEFAEWARQRLGQRRYDALRVMANKPTKFAPAERELMHEHYLGEKKRMMAMRKEGVAGRIDFYTIGEVRAA